MNKQDLEILYNTLGTKERPPEFAVRLLEETCARTGLDWKARHVYLMVRNSKDGPKWSVVLSIDGFRMIGAQEQDYAGQEGPYWTDSPDGKWTDIPPERVPYAAKVGIKKRDGTVTWGVAKYQDYRASPMWDKFPSTMIAKCAEMLGWRKTFPGKLGGLYGLEEMAQADKTAQAKVEASVDVEEAQPGASNSREVEWWGRLQLASSLEELREMGVQISRDKLLDQDAVMRLHTEFTRLKKRWDV